MMTYYKHKNNEGMQISVGRALFAVLMIGMLVIGIVAREPLHDAFFGPTNVDVTGEWVGIVTEDYGIEVRYEYRLYFEEKEDGIVGAMRVTSTNLNTTIMADSIIMGDVVGDTLTYEETQVMRLAGVAPSHWCRISASLDHETIDGQETLTGTWHGIETPGVSGCDGTEGRIILTRQ